MIPLSSSSSLSSSVFKLKSITIKLQNLFQNFQNSKSNLYFTTSSSSHSQFRYYYYSISNIDSINKKSLHNQPQEKNIQYFDPEVKLEKFAHLYQSDQKVKEVIKRILNFYEYLKYNVYKQLPSTLSLNDMLYILQVHQFRNNNNKIIISDILKCFEQLGAIEKKRIMRKEKKEEFFLSFEERKIENDFFQGIWKKTDNNVKMTNLEPSCDDGGHKELYYGLWHNNLFIRFNTKYLTRYKVNHKVRLAGIFGQKLIVDLDYGDQNKLMKFRHIEFIANNISEYN